MLGKNHRMELTIDEALRKGVEAHKAGRLQEADRFYTAILKAQTSHPDANHNMGVLAVGVGKVEQSLPFFKTALEANPSITQFWLSYIDALIKLDKLDDARTLFNQATEKGIKGDAFENLKQKLERAQPGKANTPKIQNPPKEELQPLIDLYTNGYHNKALEAAEELLQVFPHSVTLYNIKGAANAALKKYEHAIASYRKAIGINPNYAEGYYNMGNAAKAKGSQSIAIENYNQAIKIKPDYVEAHYNMGNTYSNIGDLDAAIESYRKVLEIKPDDVEATNNIGNCLKEKGDLEGAIESYKRAIKIKPDYAEAYYNMGVTYNDEGDLEAAEKSYKRAIKIKPDYAEAHYNMGMIQRNKGNDKGSKRSYEKVLEIKPDYIEAHHNLSIIKKYKERDEQFVLMEGIFNNQTTGDDERCQLCFALAKACEDLGDLKSAFNFLKEGNTLRKKLLDYTIREDVNLFKNLKKAYPNIKKNISQVTETSSDLKPIFILGMPRSGTTLVEQIVSSHSKVTGAGELTYVRNFGDSIARGASVASEKALIRFRKQYLLELQKRSNGNTFVTDKTPWNFKYIGLISSTIPESKIIHIQRNPAATCWSNYKRYFPTHGLGYCYDLNDLVNYYQLYRELMQFWMDTSDVHIYNLNYDNLTTNQEDETKKLIQYLELNWEDACLFPQNNKRSVATASNLQVRQKVYQGSSAEWQKFAPFIKGVFSEL